MTMKETVVICAVRYALGRMSYVVSDVCDYVNFHTEELSSGCIRVIMRDIDEELAMCHRVGKTCGMECDEAEWVKLLEVLREELRSRG